MKKLMSLALALLMVASLAGCGGTSSENTPPVTSSGDVTVVAPVLDISLIAGKTAAQVESVLGVPTQSEPSSFTLKSGTSAEAVSNTYNDGTEIFFISDAAARISIYPPAGSKVEDGAALIGLTPDQAGTSSYNGVEDYSWSDNTEYYSISAFNTGDGTISYIYVVTNANYR